MKIETLVVLVKADNGAIHQVALTDEMIDCLKSDLRDYFKGGVIKVMPTEITTIAIESKTKAV